MSDEKDIKTVPAVVVPEPVWRRIVSSLSKQPYEDVAGLLDIVLRYQAQQVTVE